MLNNFSNTINLWRCHSNDWDKHLKLKEILSTDERQKLLTYKIENDKKRFCIGRIMLRTIASEYLQLPPNNLDIKLNKSGKPYFHNRKKLHFNISHSGDLVVVAFANSEVGVDVQELSTNKKIDFDTIAKNYFHNKEIKYINDSEAGEKLKRFYEIWCIKEAIIKARGIDFYAHTDKFCVLPINNKTMSIDNMQVTKNYLDNKHVWATAIDCNTAHTVLEYDFTDFQT